MRSRMHGTFATLLLMVPVLSIPALAIFGIPQFAPVVASPLDEGPSPSRERRLGQSARPSGDSFLGDLEEAPSFGSEPEESSDQPVRGQPGESVAIPRGRRFADQNAATAPLPSEPAPRWEDNSFPSARVAPARELDSASASKRAGESSGLDLRDQRFESRAAAPKIQQVSVGSSMGARAPQVYQRHRDSSPEQPAESRPAAVSTEPLTWQGAVRRLNDLEIRNFRLQPGHRDNEFVFICSYTPSDSPRVSYRFEAEADEPLKAVEKVLEQIVEWQQRR